MSGYAYLGIVLAILAVLGGAVVIGIKIQKGKAARENLERRARIDEEALKIDEETDKLLDDLNNPNGVNDFWMHDKPE